MRLNILALSYLFPNRVQPDYGIFVLNRLRAVSQWCNVKVIAPVQWYPLIHRLRRRFWSGKVPERERQGDIDVFHPRFAVIPRYMKWLDALTFLWSTQRVARELRDAAFEYDLIDVHWTYPDIVAGWFLARRSGRKYVVTVRGHEALYDTEITIRRWLVALFLRRADYVVTLSSELRDKVIALGVAPERARVVLNGVDLSGFNYKDQRESRAQLGLDPQKRIIISVGRLTSGKGHDVLVRMMPMLAKTHDVELYIVGGVNPEDDFGHVLKKMIADLGLTATVHLVDKVPHEKLALWYGAADLFCLATRGEGCPNVVLEALACGTPVVITRVGAVDELIEPGVNGLLIEPQAISSFGAEVQRGLEQPWDRRQIAERMTRWGWSACAEQVLSVYRAALQ